MIKTKSGTIGQRIRLARMMKQQTQEDMARSLGIDQSEVSRYETGKVTPSVGVLKKVAGHLGLGLDDLVGK